MSLSTEVGPPELPEGWSARPPVLEDLDALVALRRADQQPWTGSDRVDVAAIESEIAGIKSWSRRQLVLVREDGVPQAWVLVHDRAAGRTMVHLYVDRDLPEADALAAALYRWTEEQALAIARLREVSATRLDASPFEDDTRQLGWLADAGYDRRRVWLHMERPVDPEADQPDRLPPLREGVSIRRVASHENGLPVAEDLQTVHEMLELSFEDHFNSYRESFPEFVQRLREEPGHRWDHWWLAFVTPSDDPGGEPVAAGALVCSVLPAGESGSEGSYVEYIGVNRRARGRGVAKGLLHTVIGDAAERGRDRVGLEVDDDSPTSADQLYRSMGWETDYVTDSWFKDLVSTP